MSKELIEEQIHFLRSPINSSTSYIHRWRRDYIAGLLQQYKKNLEFTETLQTNLEKKHQEIDDIKKQFDDHLQKEKDKVNELFENFQKKQDIYEKKLGKMQAYG